MQIKKVDDIIRFLKENIEPMNNDIYGPGYRASAHLTDGTFIPCVVFRPTGPIVNLAIRRFKEELTGKSVFSRSSGLGYNQIVKSFVANGNCLNSYDINKIEISKYAFPVSIINQIKGETTMGWTGFAAKMNDGKYVGFGSSFNFDFFQMPEEYSVNDIAEIINHCYVLNTGQLYSHKETYQSRPNNYEDAIVYRERPFFECYLDNL